MERISAAYFSSYAGENNGCAITQDGQYLYVALYTNPARVIKVDPVNMQRGLSVTLASGEANLYAITQDGQYLYVVNANKVVKIDPVNMQRISAADLIGREGGGYAITYDGQYLYVAINRIPARVEKIDPVNMQHISAVELASGENYGQGITYDGQYLYVVAYLDPIRVIKVDPVNMERISAVTLASGERNGRAITCDRQYLYVATFTSPTKVVKIDSRNMQRISAVDLPSGQSSPYAITQDGQYLYVATSTRVTKIDPVNMECVSSVDLASGEYGIRGITQIGQYLYVVTYTTPAMVVKIDSGTPIDNNITGSVHFNSATTMQVSAETCRETRIITGSVRFNGVAYVSIRPINVVFLGAVSFAGSASARLRAQKTAIAKTRMAGKTIMDLRALVLCIPPGVYSIGADEIFNRNQPITPDSLANYIEVWINPLKPVATAEEVYKTDQDDPIPINAGETKIVTVHYKKEPVTEATISLANAPSYAAITNIKYYAWGADVTVTSPSTGAFELVATGKPLEVQGREMIVKKDDISILENGIKKYTFDNPFVQDRATAEMIGAKLLSFAIPQADIEIDWRGDPALVLADVTMIPEFQRQGLDQRGIFYVTKQELEFDGGLRAKLEGRKMGGE